MNEITGIEWIAYYSLIILGQLLFITALVHMIIQRRSPASMIAWLLAIILLPYLAVPLYFLLGSRKHRKKIYKSTFSMQAVNELPHKRANPVDTILRNNNIPGATQGNRFELYTDGTSAFASLMRQIEQAKESIFIGTYIFDNDPLTQTLLNALSKKAKEGIEVKVLIDALGSFRLYFFQHPLKTLRKAGGKVLFFMPMFQMPFRNYINLRNHRKIYLFDQRIVLTGGMNLSAEYMGPEPDAQRWNDLLFLAEGPAVFHYFEIFASDWKYASGMDTLPTSHVMLKSYGDACMQVVPSGPDVESDALYEALISAIHAATKRIWIVTPYFVPHGYLMRSLIIAKHKGVDVKVITPRESDHLIADLGRSSYMRELEEADVHVALYEGRSLHAKAILFDEDITMLGSLNIDNRSLFLNYEVVSFTFSPAIAADVEKWMKGLLKQSGKTMEPASKARKIGENLMRVIASQL